MIKEIAERIQAFVALPPKERAILLAQTMREYSGDERAVAPFCDLIAAWFAETSRFSRALASGAYHTMAEDSLPPGTVWSSVVYLSRHEHDDPAERWHTYHVAVVQCEKGESPHGLGYAVWIFDDGYGFPIDDPLPKRWRIADGDADKRDLPYVLTAWAESRNVIKTKDRPDPGDECSCPGGHNQGCQFYDAERDG